jgi:hypothetical protein
LDRFRKAYETHRPTFRTWWPLFYWLIDVACINAYRLYQLYIASERPLTHLQFRTELYCKLLRYSTKAKLQSLWVELGGKKVCNPDFQHLHYWEKRTCPWYLYKSRCQKILGKVVEAKGRAKRSTKGRAFVNVHLCKEGNCWTRFHSNNVDY